MRSRNHRCEVPGRYKVLSKWALLFLELPFLISPLFLGLTYIQFLILESALLDWWSSDIPRARSGVAGRHRGQAAGPSLPGPSWETFWSPHYAQESGVRGTSTVG